MTIHLHTRVQSVQVKAKKVKTYDRETKQTYEETLQVGHLHLEFDDIVHVRELAELIGDRPVIIGVADSQIGLGGHDAG